jgi:hypothetical protein
MNTIESIAARFATPVVHWIALLGLCAAYLQGGIVKATDFGGAIGEMEHFGLTPADQWGSASLARRLSRPPSAMPFSRRPGFACATCPSAQPPCSRLSRHRGH